MAKFQVAYIPVGVPTFHLESAQKEFEKSIKVISAITENAVFPEKMLLSIEDLKSYMDTINPNIIIFQNITFANAAYVSEVVKRFTCPLLLWTLREPVIDGGRLRLNSLTGAYSAANAMHTLRNGKFEYVFGSPEESAVKRKLEAVVKAAEVKEALKNLKMVSIGHTPQGFGFGRALDLEILSAFGVTLEAIEARELLDLAKSYTREEYLPYLERFQKVSTGFLEIPEERMEGFARLYKAYKEYAEKNGIEALSSRCWPDFFTAFGTPVCAVLSMLNDDGISSACESDAFGALSMYIGRRLSGNPVFFGDPVSMEEEENTITYWHCGMAACSLAQGDKGAQIGVHPNRKIGPVMDFGCKACDAVTIFRVGRLSDGSFRFFVASGEALEKPKQFCGTSVVVKVQGSASAIVNKSVKDGWEPHFVVIYGEVKEELKMLGSMLNIEVMSY